MITNFETNENIYRCKLSTQALINIEKELGINPVNLLFNVTDKAPIPNIETMATILFYSLQQYNHGINRTTTYGIIDEYIESGKGLTDLFAWIIDLFVDSGVLGKPDEITEQGTEQENSKN